MAINVQNKAKRKPKRQSIRKIRGSTPNKSKKQTNIAKNP